jgi:anti-anti-sigma factor
MSDHRDGDGQERGGIVMAVHSPGDGRGIAADPPAKGGRPRLRVRTIERTVLVRFEGAEILFEEEAVGAVGRELHHLIEERRHARLVVNFAGVRYISSEVLGILAGLQREADPVRGNIVLCGLDPLLRDMVRITRLDRVFDVCGDEAEALGLILC